MVTRVTLLEDTLDSTDSTTAVDLGASGHRCICCEAIVSAVDGTDPTLDLVLETSADGTTWTELCSWDQAVAVGTYRILPDRTERYIRLSWVVGGTDSPEFTVKVIGYSFDSYCSAGGLVELGLPEAALASVPIRAIAKNLETASTVCKTYLAKFYTMPLIAWSESLNRSVAMIASYDLMSVKGYNPTASDNTTFRDRYKDAIKWLEDTAMDDPDIEGSPAAEDTNDGAGSTFSIASDCRRGWE